MTEIEFLFDGPAETKTTLVLAHGAGAPMDSDFMAAFARGLGTRGLRVLRFEFPYMAARRADGRKRPPDRQPKLLETWSRAISQALQLAAASGRVAIGGKSMGGRMASLAAETPGVSAVVCLGYPFHPPGKPDRLRTEHLAVLQTPCLIVQGTRDPFGTRDEVSGYALSRSVRLHWAEDGNHDLTPRKASGRSQEQNWEDGMDAVAAFLRGV